MYEADYKGEKIRITNKQYKKLLDRFDVNKAERELTQWGEGTIDIPCPTCEEVNMRCHECRFGTVIEKVEGNATNGCLDAIQIWITYDPSEYIELHRRYVIFENPSYVNDIRDAFLTHFKEVPK